MTDPTSPHTGTQPVVPISPTYPGVAVPTAPRPAGSTAVALIIAGLATVLLVAVGGIILFTTTDGPSGQRGVWNGPIAYPEGMGDGTYHDVVFAGETVYFRTTSQDRKTWITAADAKTGAEKWSLDEGLAVGEEYSVTYIDPGQDALLVQETASSSTNAFLVDAKTGKAHELTSQDSGTYHRMIGGVPVRTTTGGDMEVLDANGDKIWDASIDVGSGDNTVAVASADNLGDLPYAGNPIDAKQLLTVGYDGSVKILDKKDGKVVTEKKSAVTEGSVALLAFDDVLYAKTTNDDRTRETITAYDMKDDFAKIDSWKGEKGQTFTQLSPCTAKLMCASGYWTSEPTRSGNAVIDLKEGVVWKAPEDKEASYASISFVGDTMAVAYFSSYSTDSPIETQLYDKDFKEMGEILQGWYTAADDKVFAAVSASDYTSAEAKVYDAEVSIVEAEDGRVSKLDSYPAYPGCEIAGPNLACATEPGYRLWKYRD
ncbi:PQQ-binding-like beta-propeller repeat protein [Stackebrandtia nassauensis]|uniref:Pyrrolo-quinoline quinone n=1 Tax=Stackebrandtia nassauensis (strain DSM 44728 / CIP 108903 / NRRL B-16338 / NBRC 102104 / LLR-40K-21) TaxID=446470 RepID=D3Q9C4_STANL|nr:WD40 repeat domain-containing protein [Stackebrandtia nassauensis]ADD42606.1 hypothetical protein Snas_2931 [Stackebrandtia nassauensis DSM 44728]